MMKLTYRDRNSTLVEVTIRIDDMYFRHRLNLKQYKDEVLHILREIKTEPCLLKQFILLGKLSKHTNLIRKDVKAIGLNHSSTPIAEWFSILDNLDTYSELLSKCGIQLIEEHLPPIDWVDNNIEDTSINPVYNHIITNVIDEQTSKTLLHCRKLLYLHHNSKLINNELYIKVHTN